MYKYKTLQVGQLPQEHLSLLQSLLNFIIIITKYLKQESNDDLCRCMDEHSPLASEQLEICFINVT